MVRLALRMIVGLSLSAAALGAESGAEQLVWERWFEIRTAHFNVYSSANPSDVTALASHLEQFSEAYTLLAGGARAVASPPIIVLAFADHESLKPFLPLYQGKPKNVAGFFKRGSDENLIVLAVPSTNAVFSEMGVIFHEYAHLLFRHNARTWPLWLNEGMADVYSTFETSGYTVRIARPIEPYLFVLSRQALMPLRELFAVTTESPQYNERDRQGLFYAESWLLAHYLTSGGIVGYRARFGQFTRLLRDGQSPEQAFTNALQTSLPAMESELRRYLERGVFPPLQWALPMNVASAKAMAGRPLGAPEVCFRVGDELMRIDRLDDAEKYFQYARKIAPMSPLPYEGLGLLAAERENREEAARWLKEALQRGSVSFLAHFAYARAKVEMTADSKGRYTMLLDEKQVAEIRSELQKAIALMPTFAPAHELLGFFETVQADDLAVAKQQLELAIQLEPEDPSYLISLAQAQWMNHEPEAARQTLAPLLRPSTEIKLRQPAEELLKRINRDPH